MAQSATLFDGTSARAHSVSVERRNDGLFLQLEDGSTLQVPANLLCPLSDDDHSVRVGRTDVEGWSLRIDKPLDEGIAAALPTSAKYGRWIDRVGLGPALGVLGVLTATLVGVGYLAPQWIAPHIPMSLERKMGSAMFGDFGAMRCNNAGGQQALETLVERVSPGATKGPDGIKVAALNIPAFNAAALPGGYIVVFKPAITESNPDALAGVLAHEVAHVRRRHVMEAVIRELGIGAIIRLFAGDLGANAEQVVDLSYTRGDEAQADSDAIAMLKRAHISPKPTADLFADLSKKQGEGSSFSAEFLQSHPLSGKRAERFAASFDPHQKYVQPLTRDQWDALFDICRKPVK